MKIARLRLRIIDKATRRTYVASWFAPGCFICAATGSMRVVDTRAGYSEYNDRGQPVLDSWIEPTPMVRLV